MKTQKWVPVWIGRVAFIIGFLDILANVNSRWRIRVHALNTAFPAFVTGSALAAAIFTGLLLMILARGLGRRKRRAWIST